MGEGRGERGEGRGKRRGEEEGGDGELCMLRITFIPTTHVTEVAR